MGEIEKSSSSCKTVLLKLCTMGDGRGVKSGSLPVEERFELSL